MNLFELKFMFSKKATRTDKIFTAELTLYSKCQIDGEDFVNFCGLLRKLELYVFPITVCKKQYYFVKISYSMNKTPGLKLKQYNFCFLQFKIGDIRLDLLEKKCIFAEIYYLFASERLLVSMDCIYQTIETSMVYPHSYIVAYWTLDYNLTLILFLLQIAHP